MELHAETSVHTCPNCQEVYRLQGVNPGQEIICFKCHHLFTSSPHSQEPSYSNKITLSPNKKDPIAEFSLSNRHYAFYWGVLIIFFLFVLIWMTSSPQSVSTTNYLNQAETSFEQKNYRQASKLFQQHLKNSSLLKDKNRLEVYWKIGLAEEKSGQIKNAVKWNQKILNEYSQTKDWKIHSAKRALNRLEAWEQN